MKNEECIGIVYAFGVFTDEERSEIKEKALELMPVKEAFLVHLSVEAMAGYLIIGLGFITGVIAVGFFRAMGSDAYNRFRDSISKILSKKNRPSINFTMRKNSTIINIKSNAENEEEIKKVFDTIDKARDLAVNALNMKEPPKLTELNIIYINGDFKIDSAQNWNPPDNIEYYTYDVSKQKWELIGPIFMKNGNVYKIDEKCN